MREIIKRVLDNNGVLDGQDDLCGELISELTNGGYVHIDSIKLDTEKMILCVSKIVNELQQLRPIVIKG